MTGTTAARIRMKVDPTRMVVRLRFSGRKTSMRPTVPMMWLRIEALSCSRELRILPTAGKLRIRYFFGIMI